MGRFFLILLLTVPACSFAAEYYWVGGSGNWSDLSHWATTSGGSVQYPQAPSSDDNVIFDGNSFSGPGQRVVMDSEIGFCLSFTCTGLGFDPVFELPEGNSLNVFGNFQLEDVLTVIGEGTVRFQGNGSNVLIDARSKTIAKVLLFENGNANWTLGSGLSVDSLIEIRSGNLTTGGQPVTSGYFHIRSGTDAINLDGSLITLDGTFSKNRADEQAPVFTLESGVQQEGAGTHLLLTSIRPGMLVNGLVIDSVSFTNSNGKGIVETNDFNSVLDIQYLDLGVSVELNARFRIDQLRLAPGKTYRLAANYEHQLNVLNAEGTCEQPIQLLSTEPGSPATLTANGGAILGQGVVLRDIHARGSSNFFIDQGVDLGNTDGWQINSRSPQTLYWVGGTGSWHDASNWSQMSGGPGGSCIPSGIDDVVFDQNSFSGGADTVTIIAEDAFCNSMRWTNPLGAPVLAMPDPLQINLFGSLQLTPNIELATPGLWRFTSNLSGNTIQTEGRRFEDVVFAGGGAWSLLDSLISEETVTLLQGTLDISGQYMKANRINVWGTATWILENALVHVLPGGRWYPLLEMDRNGIQVRADGSLIEFDYGTFTADDSDGNTAEELRLHKVRFLDEGSLFRSFQGFSYIDTLEIGRLAWVWDGLQVGTLQLGPGAETIINNGDSLILDRLESGNDCNFPSMIRSRVNGLSAFIEFREDITTDLISFADIVNTGAGKVRARQGADLGGNTGIDFLFSPGRSLYWVNEGGDWNEPNHWSLSSGGSGGECPPGPNDKVFFDANSFSGPGQTVFSSIDQGFCRDMQWEPGVQPAINFNLYRLGAFGSVQFNPEMNLSMSYLYLQSDDPGQLYASGNQRPFSLVINGEEYQFQDTVKAFSIIHQAGTVKAGASVVEIQDYENVEDLSTMLQMDSSSWLISGQGSFGRVWENFGLGKQLIGGSSQVEFTDPFANIYTDSELQFNRVLFSASTGESLVFSNYSGATGPKFNQLEFRNSAYLNGSWEADSLIFTAGKSYRLANNFDKIAGRVNEYWRCLGNNCVPIQLRSDREGSQSLVITEGAEVRVDFVVMQDQRVESDRTVFAGLRSTDAGNNTNWVFDTPEDLIEDGFLGNDQVLCSGMPVELDARNFNPGESYRWQDGSTEPFFTADQAGFYWADVTFGDNCSIRDSVQVLAATEFTSGLPGDTVLCAGDTLTLEASATPLAGLKVVWQDSSTATTFTVTEPGTYKVVLELEGCTTADSVEIRYQDPPLIELGNDTLLCLGDSLLLSVPADSASFTWQDGTTGPDYLVTLQGVYTLRAAYGTCASQDSVRVDYYAPIEPDLGPDTAFCEQGSLLLDPGVSAESWLWSDGSTGSTLLANSPGAYWVETTVNRNCKERDSLQLGERPIPRFEFGADTILCEGEAVDLDPGLSGLTYLWEDGSSAIPRTVSQNGVYRLTVSDNGCSYSDTIRVGYVIFPENILGADRSACEGERIRLDATFGMNTAYEWQDGSTNSILETDQTGLYSVVLRDGRCMESDSVNLTFNLSPTFDLGNDTLLCEGEVFTLNPALPVGANFMWSDGSTEIPRTFPEREEAEIWLRAESFGCIYVDSLQYRYVLFPEDLLGPDFTSCEGNVELLEATNVEGATYVWQDGSTGNTFQAETTGTYAVSATVGRCFTEDEIDLVFNPLPRFELGTDTNLCEGQTVLLSISAQADSYVWNDGLTASSREVSLTGNYEATAEAAGCTFSDAIAVNVQSPPVFDLGPDTILCEGTTYPLTLMVPVSAMVSWQDGQSGIQYLVQEAGEYAVTVTLGGCTETVRVSIDYRTCQRFELYAPNAFSPNGDGVNDQFLPQFSTSVQVLNYHLQVYDRWGNLFFESTDPTQGWDGVIRGEEAPQGAYIYLVELEYMDDFKQDRELISGDLLLIR